MMERVEGMVMVVEGTVVIVGGEAEELIMGWSRKNFLHGM
jgi:hypothetical protein